MSHSLTLHDPTAPTPPRATVDVGGGVDWMLAHPDGESVVAAVRSSLGSAVVGKQLAAKATDRAALGSVHVRSFMRKPGLRIKDPVDTEDFILHSYGKEGATVISRIVADWPAVEDALVSSLGRLDAGARTKAIEFLARGRRLFHTETRVTARVTLHGGIHDLRKALDGRDPELMRRSFILSLDCPYETFGGRF